MDDRELENVVSKFGNVVRELNRYLEPLARKWKHFGEVVAPVVLKLRSEFVKLDISDEMEGRMAAALHNAHLMPPHRGKMREGH